MRGASSTDQYPCPFCGRTIIANQEAQTIAHEAPQCDRFSALLQQMPPTETRVGTEGDAHAHIAERIEKREARLRERIAAIREELETRRRMTVSSPDGSRATVRRRVSADASEADLVHDFVSQIAAQVGEKRAIDMLEEMLGELAGELADLDTLTIAGAPR